VPALEKMSMLQLAVAVEDDLGHGHCQCQRRRCPWCHDLLRHVVGVGMASNKVLRSVLPVRVRVHHVGLLRVVAGHGAVDGLLLGGHRREHSVMPCVRVWSVLVELDLLGCHGEWAFHCSGRVVGVLVIQGLIQRKWWSELCGGGGGGPFEFRAIHVQC
jgi:hypothetical protein